MYIKNCAKLVKDSIDPSKVPSSTYYIGLEHIKEADLYLIGLGKASDVTSNKYKFQRGDILFGKLRPYFRKVICPQISGICSTDIWVIRPINNVDAGFLRYWLSSWDFVDFVSSTSEGTRMPRANWNIAKNHQTLDFDFNEQVAIAHILQTLDDKIDLNRRMNHTLESIAKALFKSWFIDFDPVQAKIQGRDTGLPKEIEDLFPSQMVDSEVGFIPEGWSFWSVAELAECRRKNLTPYKQPDTVFEYYSYPAYSAGQIPFSELGSSIKSSKYLLPLNSVLLGKLDPMKQKVWFPNNPDSNPQIATTEFLPFTPLKGIGRALIYQLFKSDRFGSVYKGMVTGTSHQRVPLDAILRITCMAGNISIFEKFERIVFPMLMKVLSNRREIARLVNLRDTLLPKLISGDLRILDMNQDLD